MALGPAEKHFFRPDVARDVDDELAHHLEMRERELVAQGIVVGDARDAVVRRAIFSLANWALLRPLPAVERPPEVQQMWTGTRRGPTSFRPSFSSYPNLLDIVPRLQTMTIAGEQARSAAIGRGDEGARPVPLAYVTASCFDVPACGCWPGVRSPLRMMRPVALRR